ncbi:MAG TPA: GntR family transcriptional regulator [Alphaproteobacteria bacterium]|jgi:DNA-binding GntR family transcriptional regulator|nr:GntR family transcriptional regulator [Alphaproteobacteria bacterium]
MKARNSAAASAAVADLEPPSLRARAYEEIKRRIITLQYRPGEYLNEAMISEQLGIGRTPVHQALDRLMLEDMVEVIPRKGVIVRPVSLDEVLQLIEVRLVNETHCVALAAQRATEAEIDELAAILGPTQTLIDLRDIEGLMLLDRNFHAGISAAAKNRVLANILLTLHERSLRFWFISLSDEAHLIEVRDQHVDIHNAIRARDPAAASQAMREHIESFRQNIMKSV